jgi:hypothetical protein
MFPYNAARFGNLAALAAGGGGGGGGGVTWNTADKTGTITLSGSNLTATLNSSSIGVVRGSTSHTSGKYYFEATVGTASSTPFWQIGLATATKSLTPTYLGDDTNGLGFSASGADYYNAGNQSSWVSAAPGDVICLAVDFTNAKVWARLNGGNWLNDVIGNQNPATNTGGITGLTGWGTFMAGPLFPAWSGNTSGDAATANFGGTSYAQTPPSGFGNW